MSAEQTRTQLQKRWILSMPPNVQDLIARFPPLCKVKPRRPLRCPKILGQIASYTEDGQVSVVENDNPIRGFCDPSWLEFVGESEVSRAQVREWIEESTNAQEPDV